MNAQFVQPTMYDEDRRLQDQALKNKRFGLLLWRLANGGVFVFFIFANYLMRSVAKSWPPEGVAPLNAVIPTVISVILLASAIPAIRAQAAIRRGDNVGLRRNILLTMAAGSIFVVGIIYVMLHVPYSASYSSIVLAMSGFHAVHAIVGLLLFGYVYQRARTYTTENHWGVEATVVFWHFVDLMWVFFFLVLYVF